LGGEGKGRYAEDAEITRRARRRQGGLNAKIAKGEEAGGVVRK
jgi:hypothetical protein